MSHFIDLENRYGAHNYAPLPVVLTRGKGCYVWDEHGKSYLDAMSAYSAVSHGHAHPRLVAALDSQARTLSVVSRAFHTDRLGPFLERACELTGQDRALAMNSGAEAVETALKAARKWAYQCKGVETDCAEIIACEGNFHGRTIAAVAMSTEPQYREGFGPFPDGFVTIPYGDADALASAITPATAAFIVEPLQGEGGIVIPPPGWLARCAEICREQNVLLICDEIQTGLGRCGSLLACEQDGVKPDGLLLGKALGGGLLPVSLFLTRTEVMEVFRPGDHGSTFGGNALAAAVGLEALNVLIEDDLIGNSRRMGDYLRNGLRAIESNLVIEIRGRGLFVGVEVDASRISARAICLELMKEGVLTRETHESVIRIAPPLIINRKDTDMLLGAIGDTLQRMRP